VRNCAVDITRKPLLLSRLVRRITQSRQRQELTAIIATAAAAAAAAAATVMVTVGAANSRAGSLEGHEFEFK